MPSYDTTWPNAYPDQKSYADYLLARAKILYARRAPITINKFIEPSQGDWENAYVASTGLPLPIPTGVKLFWRSLNTGRVTQYGTIDDLTEGSASSGTVFNLLSMNYTQPAMRFLGFMDSTKQIFNMHITSSSPVPLIPVLSWMPSGSFIYGINNSQIYYWMTQGLESLMLMYRVRTNDLIAAPPSTFNVLFNRGGSADLFTQVSSGSNNMESQYTKFAGNVAVMATFGNPVATVSSAVVPVSGTLNGSDSAASTHSYGQMWLHNVAQQLEPTLTPDGPRENYHNPIGYAKTSYLGATITDANAALSWGMFTKEDNGFAASNFFDVGLNYPVAGVGVHSAKLWVYGLFKNPTGELRG